MNENPEVSAWPEALEHPLKEVIVAARLVLLEADDRISETIKWKSHAFMSGGNLASIDPKVKRHVSVLFHRGPEIPGDHAPLEGDGKVARYIRFGDVEAVERGRSGLISIARAWCDSKD